MADPLHGRQREHLRPVDRPAENDAGEPVPQDTGRHEARSRPEGMVRLGRWRLDFHRFLSRLLLVLLLIWVAGTMVQQQLVIVEMEHELTQQQQTLAVLQAQQEAIAHATEALSSRAAIEEAARIRLGYTRPDEILFIITEDQEQSGRIIIDRAPSTSDGP